MLLSLPCLTAMLLALIVPALAFAADAAADCRDAPIRILPPTSEQWRTALGPDSSKMRILIRGVPEPLVAFDPKWDPQFLVAYRQPMAPDTLHIAWTNIARVDNRASTGNPGRGMTIGAALGVAVPFLIILAADSEAAGYTLFFLPLTVPLGIIIGGSIANTHEWIPVFCSSDPQGGLD